MTNDQLQELELRVARLEEEVQRIRSSLNESRERWWEKTAGMFEGDKAFSEIVRLGREIRRGTLTIKVTKPRKRSVIGRNKKNSPIK